MSRSFIAGNCPFCGGELYTESFWKTDPVEPKCSKCGSDCPKKPDSLPKREWDKVDPNEPTYEDWSK